MTANNVFSIAYKYHTLGLCVIPSGGGHDGKQALIRWKLHQSERPEFEKYLLDILRNHFLAEDILTLAQGFNKLTPLRLSKDVARVYEWALSSPEIQRRPIREYFTKLGKKKAKRPQRNSE